MEAAITRIATQTAEAHEAVAEVTYTRGYPPTINHPEQTERAAAALAEILGEDKVRRDHPPSMGGEDFSFLLNERPGAFLLLRPARAGRARAACRCITRATISTTPCCRSAPPFSCAWWRGNCRAAEPPPGRPPEAPAAQATSPSTAVSGCPPGSCGAALVLGDLGQQVHQIAVVRHVAGDVGMRPVGAPQHPVRRRLQRGAGEGHGIAERAPRRRKPALPRRSSPRPVGCASAPAAGGTAADQDRPWHAPAPCDR